MIGCMSTWCASWGAAWQPGVIKGAVNKVFRGITGYVAQAIAGFGLVFVVQMALSKSMTLTPVSTGILWGLYAWAILLAYIPRILSTLNRTPRPYTDYLYYFLGYIIILMIGGGVSMFVVGGPFALMYGVQAVTQSAYFKTIAITLTALINGMAAMCACAWADRKKGVEDAISTGARLFFAELPYIAVMLLAFLPLAAPMYWQAYYPAVPGQLTIIQRATPLLNAVWQLATWMLWTVVYQARKGKKSPVRRTVAKKTATPAKKRPMKRVTKK